MNINGSVDLFIIYGFFVLFIFVGVLFLIRGLRIRQADAPESEPVSSRAVFRARPFIRMGIIFAGIGLLGIIYFTIMLTS